MISYFSIDIHNTGQLKLYNIFTEVPKNGTNLFRLPIKRTKGKLKGRIKKTRVNNKCRY